MNQHAQRTVTHLTRDLVDQPADPDTRTEADLSASPWRPSLVQPRHTPARLVIADPFPVNRRGIRAALRSDSGVLVVAEASTGPESLAVCQHLQPDLLVMDLQLPGLSWRRALHVLGRVCPDMRVLMFGVEEDAAVLDDTRAAGAAGYIPKACSEAELLQSIWAAMSGENRQDDARLPLLRTRVPGGLSPREREVLELLTHGLTNRQIAARLVISPSTAKAHVAQILAKLDVKTRTEAAVRATQFGR